MNREIREILIQACIDEKPLYYVDEARPLNLKLNILSIIK